MFYEIFLEITEYNDSHYRLLKTYTHTHTHTHIYIYKT